MKKEKKEKLKYGLWNNAGFMIASAFRVREPMTVFLCLIVAVLAVLNHLLGLFLSPAVLKAVETGVPLSELVLTILFFVGATMLVAALNDYLRENTLFGRVGVRTYLLSLLMKKSLRTSYQNIEDDRFAKAVENGGLPMNGNNASGEAFWGTFTSLIQNVLGFAVYVLLLTSVEPFLILVILVTSLVGYVVNKYATSYKHRHRELSQRENDRLGHLYEVVRDERTAKDIRIFGLRPWIEEIYQKSFDLYTAFERRAQNSYLVGSIVSLLMTFLRNGIAYAYLIAMVLNEGLSVSEFLLYFSAVGGFSGWLTGILGDLISMHRHAVDMAPFREALDYPEVFRFEDGKKLEFDPKGSYEIRLENVSFHYPNSEKPVLEHINLTLHKGEKLAVVGLNGAGKTTLIRIIAGLLDPTEGRVLLDGRDIREYDRRDYYRMFSAVFQTFSVIPASIAKNVALGEGDIDYDRVRACIEKAGLTKKIESLPEGLETKLVHTIYDDAIMLSGGETQRLILARALYREAPFVLLDEPTAALDPIAEADMYRKYNDMTKGRSSVYISHRLASTRFCDRVLLLDGSVIAEEGTHESLIQKGGKYAELFAVQSKYYKEDFEDEK